MKLPSPFRKGHITKVEEDGTGTIKLTDKENSRNGEIVFHLSDRRTLTANGSLKLESSHKTWGDESTSLEKGACVICIVTKKGGQSVARQWATEADSQKTLTTWEKRTKGKKNKKEERAALLALRRSECEIMEVPAMNHKQQR